MPNGNFPLNDDWNYARSVKALLDEQKLIITHWSLAASLPHIALGWLASKIAGFSFDALRTVSMIGGFVSGILTYFIAARAGASRFYALLASALWLTNPLVFSLSTTFMTDVTFIMLAAITIALCTRMIFAHAIGWRDIAIATVLAALLCLTRQTGLVIPIALLLATRFNGKAWLPLVTAIAAVVAFQTWLNTAVGPLHSYVVEQEWLRQLVARGPAFIMSNTMSNLICAFVYLGLFLFPFFIAGYPAFLRSLTGTEKRSALIMFTEPVILLAVGLILTHSIMPLVDNVLFDLGLGPILLGGGMKPHYFTAPKWFWVLITTCGVIGAGALLSLLVLLAARIVDKKSTLNTPQRTFYSFLLATFVMYLAVIGFRGFFDRYLIFPLFLLLPIVASTAPALPPGRMQVAKPLAMLFVLLFAVFGIAGTHDYFDWNRARWQAAHDLVDVQGISPMEIDGGLEFNGWYGYDPKYRDSGGIVLLGDMRHNNEYVIAMQPLSNYEVLSRYSFQRWLPFGTGEIIVQHKVH